MNSNPGAIRACAMGLFDFALFDQFAILRKHWILVQHAQGGARPRSGCNCSLASAAS